MRHDILSLLNEWDKKDCMDAPLTFHMRNYYGIKSQNHDPDTPTYMKVLSGEHADEYHKTMDYEIQSLMRRYT